MNTTQSVLGRRPEVSDEKIIEAGNKLTTDGRRVTGFGLRKAVGDSGDPTRLLKVWQAYLSSQSNNVDNVSATLPVELEETLNSVVAETTTKLKSLATELNAAAVETAEQRVAAAIKLANEREQVAEAEVHDASITIDDLEAQLITISLELAKCKQALQLAKDETEGQIKLAGEFNIEVATLAVQLNGREQENENLRLSLTDSEQRIENAQIEISELKAEKTELRDENKRLINEVSKLSNEREKQLSDLISKLNKPINNAA
jgi:colicin import membrane protein